MSWRYQPVEVAPDHIVLIEVYFDKDLKLKYWSDCDDGHRGIAPTGETQCELGSEACRMVVDAYCWKPVRYDDLRVGMTLERAVSAEDREQMAQMVESVSKFLSGKIEGAKQ